MKKQQTNKKIIIIKGMKQPTTKVHKTTTNEPEKSQSTKLKDQKERRSN
jgi:hypothetical protein